MQSHMSHQDLVGEDQLQHLQLLTAEQQLTPSFLQASPSSLVGALIRL
jgi:hypothetical protein